MFRPGVAFVVQHRIVNAGPGAAIGLAAVEDSAYRSGFNDCFCQ